MIPTIAVVSFGDFIILSLMCWTPLFLVGVDLGDKWTRYNSFSFLGCGVCIILVCRALGSDFVGVGFFAFQSGRVVCMRRCVVCLSVLLMAFWCLLVACWTVYLCNLTDGMVEWCVLIRHRILLPLFQQLHLTRTQSIDHYGTAWHLPRSAQSAPPSTDPCTNANAQQQTVRQ